MRARIRETISASVPENANMVPKCEHQNMVTHHNPKDMNMLALKSNTQQIGKISVHTNQPFTKK